MSLPSALHVLQRFPVDGEYVLRTVLRGVRPAGSNPVELGFWIDGKMIQEAKVAITKGGGRNANEINGLWSEIRTRIPAGEHWLSVTILRMYEGLPATYKGPNPSKTGGASTFAATDSFFPMYLDVVGPYQQTMGPSEESCRKIFGHGPGKGPHDAAR